MVAEPSALVERYPLNRINSALDELKAQKTTDLLVFVPLNILASQPAAVTANLVSPILINPKRRLGKQVVIENPQYSHRHHFL